MRLISSTTLGLLTAALLAGPGWAQEAEPGSDTGPIIFGLNLGSAVRQAISKPAGDILPADVANLTHLDASNRHLRSLKGIEHLKALQELNMGANEISDLSPLAHLTGLVRLNLSWNPISDISALKDLTNLESLELSAAQISDLSPLRDLVKLQKLGLSTNQIEDITALASLIALEELTLVSNQVHDLSPLAGLVDLQDLSLSDNPISDLTPLARLDNLTHLSLEQLPLSDISPLGQLTQMQFLGLGANQISDISPLAHLTQLQYLGLAHNQLSKIPPLALSPLQTLDLSHNQIDDIAGLANLAHLEVLLLTDNQISDISPLAHLSPLRNLDLSSNQISDISPLAHLDHLGSLNLNHNQVSDISPLLDNPGLSLAGDLWLEGNPLSQEAIEIHILELLRRGVGWVYFTERGEPPSLDHLLHQLYLGRAVLPLETGNYWVFDHISEDRRTKGVGRAEVHEQVQLPPSTEAYYKLSLTGSTGLFPVFYDQPDTLLVRADSSGNVWIKGYCYRDMRSILDEDQPWLWLTGPAEWQVNLPSGYSLRFTGHSEWIGGDRWRTIGAESHISNADDTGLIQLAQRFLPDLSALSENRLILFPGSNGGSEGGGFPLALLTGIGPLFSPLPTFEFRRYHLELSEAYVGGHLYRPAGSTAILPTSWGQVKSQAGSR